jgi:hypothetical protein
LSYPEVKNAHIVPRCYLRRFADGGSIALRVVGDAETPKTTSIDKAGTRRTFYRRHRPDGTPIDDVEWSLSQGERAAAWILRDLESRWPLPLEQKAPLACLFAVQLVRGPRWMNWRTEATNEYIEEQRAAGEEVDDFATHIHDDTQRLVQMLEMGRKMASVFGSMHWNLIEFPSPWIVTSDHPVVLWPGGVGARPPAPTPPDVGVMETLEIRIPVTPRHAILMTWSDAADNEPSRLRGSRHHAASLNAFTIAEADRQWFHHPDSAAPSTSGQLLPLSPQLLPGYGAEVAARSSRRQLAGEIVNSLIGKSLRDKDFSMVAVTRHGVPDERVYSPGRGG